jgi:teichuronic acid exporter
VSESLRSKTLHALSWSFLESIGVRGVQFVIGIILARLLFPKDFGLIGMLMIFMAVAESLIDSGFQAALIQKREATSTDTCSIFYFNIIIGIAAAALLCAVAPWIAAFYNQPILTPLTRALSLTIVINSFGSIQNTILMREIDFKTLSKASLITGVLSGIVGISMAATGFGVWSLVAQQISRAFLWTVFMWLFNAWRPALIFSLKSLREMFGFGSRILVSGLINRIFDNIYLLVIGKLFSATDLGFFTRAKVMQELPSQTLSWIVGRVTFPIFSTIQNDQTRLKRGMRKALTFLVLVNFPMMIGLAVIARPLVLVLLTEKWAECIPYLQLLCLVGLFSPVILINSNLLFALGRSKIHLRVEIIKKVLIVMNIAITWRWGISAMIYGMIVTSVMFFYLNSYYTGVLIGYAIRDQLRDLFPSLITAVLMGMAVYVVGLMPFPNLWFMLLVQISIGTVMYVCLCRLFRLWAFMEIWQVGWSKMSSLRAGTAG